MHRFRQAVSNVMANVATIQHAGRLHNEKSPEDDPEKEEKYEYSRAEFLQLSSEEVTIATDIVIRPIMVPRDLSKLPWYCGYAEVVNAGKSKRNEDQAAARHMVISHKDREKTLDTSPGNGIQKKELDQIPFTYFGIFDGHAGCGVSVMASRVLHDKILSKLESVYDLLASSSVEQRQFTRSGDQRPNKWPFSEKEVSVESLIVGAFESAFVEMDEQVRKEKLEYHIPGGCTVLVAVFILGKLYVANAGDSRAIICRGYDIIPMSTDFTPTTERQRLQQVASCNPHFLGNEFSHLEFQKRVQRKDLGKKLMYRDQNMTGWAYKEVTEADLKFPLIYGEGKKARVLATIGVTRGFGDHELKVHSTDIYIKPFLTPVPEVKVFNLFDKELTESDVLIMASDGLWDVLSNERVAEVVNEVLDSFPPDDYKKYASAAQELVMAARGVLRINGWRTLKENKQGSGDDITVFVIPLNKHYGLDRQSSLTESNDASPMSS
ncbi:protein phosphatase 1H-like [Diadema antillarum]|uniref:protein phosphatase 1H-like n=1 Tax=Diadema antillarum TaxID=105358 RepID=UPI003A8BA8C7